MSKLLLLGWLKDDCSKEIGAVLKCYEMLLPVLLHVHYPICTSRLSCYFEGWKSLRNVLGILLNLCHEEWRYICRQKKIQPGSKVYLIQGLVSLDVRHREIKEVNEVLQKRYKNIIFFCFWTVCVDHYTHKKIWWSWVSEAVNGCGKGVANCLTSLQRPTASISSLRHPIRTCRHYYLKTNNNLKNFNSLV